MNNLGIRVQLMMGETIAVPVSGRVSNALKRVEVTCSEEERAGFQLEFRVESARPVGMIGGVPINDSVFQVFNRVVIIVIVKGTPKVLMDGFITQQELQPSEEPGIASLILTGEDVSWVMDREDKNCEHPGQSEGVIAFKIIGSYAKYGIIPQVVPPIFLDPPLLSDRTPVQQCSDLQYLKQLAERHAYMFYMVPGPVPQTSTAYWGPPVQTGIPLKALSVNMGQNTNVTRLRFHHDSLAPTFVSGQVQDRMTSQITAVESMSSRRTALSSRPDWRVHRDNIRRTRFRESGCSVAQALAKAQAKVERSLNQTVRVSGELDTVRYGEILRPRELVGVRGAGFLHDGVYHVCQVTHTLSRGAYQQSFSLAREGLGTTVEVLPV